MKAFITPGLLELWGACGTKFGKTLGVSAGMAAGAWIKNKSIFRWVAPIYSQAKLGLAYHRDLIPRDNSDINKSEPSITLKSNQSKIEYRSGKNPEELEGEGVSGGYALDEAAKMARQVYDSAKTTVTLTRAPIVIISTPKSKNWFYSGCMEAKAEMEWCLKKGRAPTKIFVTIPTSANPHVPRQSLKDAKRDLPERLYRQYYESEFLDDGSVFLGFNKCVFGEPLELWGSVHTWIDKDRAKKADVVIGVDWAKKNDYTVFIAMDVNATVPKVIGYCRFQGISYIEAVKHLIDFTKKFKRVLILRHDRTGVGEAIEDMLGVTGLPCEGIVFTNQSKNSMVTQLMLTFERKEIFIPFITELLTELDSYEIETTTHGNVRYQAATGFHDDIVCALMLANSACTEMKGGFEINLLENLPEKDLSVAKWYTELIEEQEDNDEPNDE